MAWLTALQYIAYGLTAASAAKTLATKPPESKTVTTGQVGGSPAGQTQSIFTQGQPDKTPVSPPSVKPAEDPSMTTAMQMLAQSPSANQPIVVNTGNVDPGPMPKLPDQQPSIGSILNMGGSIADALGKAAPLLGVTGQQRNRVLGSPAGGPQGQVVFQMPQRQTLAQILASLPRTYNGG